MYIIEFLLFQESNKYYLNFSFTIGQKIEKFSTIAKNIHVNEKVGFIKDE